MLFSITLLMLQMVDSQLDRIMQAYNLPHDRTSLQGAASLEPVSSTRARIAKLHILLDFLGAYKLTEHDRLKRGAY